MDFQVDRAFVVLIETESKVDFQGSVVHCRRMVDGKRQCSVVIHLRQRNDRCGCAFTDGDGLVTLKFACAVRHVQRIAEQARQKSFDEAPADFDGEAHFARDNGKFCNVARCGCNRDFVIAACKRGCRRRYKSADKALQTDDLDLEQGQSRKVCVNVRVAFLFIHREQRAVAHGFQVKVQLDIAPPVDVAALQCFDKVCNVQGYSEVDVATDFAA